MKKVLLAVCLSMAAVSVSAVTLQADEHGPHMLVGSVFIHNDRAAKVQLPYMESKYSHQHTDKLSCEQAIIQIENQLIVVNPPNSRSDYGTFDRVINLSCVPVTVNVLP